MAHVSVPGSTTPARLLALAGASLALAAPSSALAAVTATPTYSGGGGLAPSGQSSNVPPPPSKNAHGTWMSGFKITEYWPAPESWFVGALVTAPGLKGKHRIDWLYSAMGVSMEGDGVGLDGVRYHLDAAGSGGWVTKSGGSTSASDDFSAGPPFWRAGGYWQNRSGGITFPLHKGGWYSGVGQRYVPLPGVRFASGPSLPLSYYQSIAVDPHLIPLGSRVYIPAYRHDGHGGWFVAQDTGGAINQRHIDVYRPPPADPNNPGNYHTNQRVFVIKSAH
jgi:3D (Asp-Asp-Asp) domain-containing protein